MCVILICLEKRFIIYDFILNYLFVVKKLIQKSLLNKIKLRYFLLLL